MAAQGRVFVCCIEAETRSAKRPKTKKRLLSRMQEFAAAYIIDRAKTPIQRTQHTPKVLGLHQGKFRENSLAEGHSDASSGGPAARTTSDWLTFSTLKRRADAVMRAFLFGAPRSVSTG